MKDPWTVAQTWTLIGWLIAGISVPTGIALWWQRKNLTPTERQWVDDWWWEYGHHFADDEGEALEPRDGAA